MSRGILESISRLLTTNLAATATPVCDGANVPLTREIHGFKMPLHYPRYTRAEYEFMPEWKLDCLLTDYGLQASGDVNQKRKFAMGAFLWNCWLFQFDVWYVRHVLVCLVLGHMLELLFLKKEHFIWYCI